MHIFIYSQIGSFGYTPEKLTDELNANPDADHIIVHISSPGGEVFDGWTIGNILRNSNKKVTTIIEGLCASIATYIALQGDTVEMAETGRFMIHNPSTFAEGEAKDMENAKKLLDGITNDLVDTYQAKTGMDEEKIREMMDAETFMTPEEAQSNGFVDTIIDGIQATAYLDPKHLNMSNNKKTETLLSKIESMLGKLVNNQNPSNIMVELAGGGQIFVESEDGDLTGKRAFMVNDEGERTDEAAPDGEHELVDGRVLVVSDGVVSEIMEGSDDTEAKLRDEIAALKSDLEDSKNRTKELEEANAAFEETVPQIIEEINNLKKVTVGGEFKPDKPNNHIPNPGRQRTTKKSGLESWAQNLPINKYLNGN